MQGFRGQGVRIHVLEWVFQANGSDLVSEGFAKTKWRTVFWWHSHYKTRLGPCMRLWALPHLGCLDTYTSEVTEVVGDFAQNVSAITTLSGTGVSFLSD